MATERLELLDEQWADLRTSLTHGQEKIILRARARVLQDPTLESDLLTAMAEAHLIAWHVLDPSSKAELPANREGLEAAPAAIVVTIAERAAEVYGNDRLPPTGAARSQKSRSARRP